MYHPHEFAWKPAYVGLHAKIKPALSDKLAPTKVGIVLILSGNALQAKVPELY